MNILRELRDADQHLFENKWNEGRPVLGPHTDYRSVAKSTHPHRAARSKEAVVATKRTDRGNGDDPTMERKHIASAPAPPSPSTDEQQGLEALHQPLTSVKAELAKLQIPQLPKQIRVRRPTKPNVHHTKLVKDLLYLYEHPECKRSLAKGPLAEAATTRTAVHLFALRPPEVYEEDAGKKQRKLSATLQVVRSRDSVYEVI